MKIVVNFFITLLVIIVFFYCIFLINKIENFQNNKETLQFIHIPKNAGTSIENLGNKFGIKWGRFIEREKNPLSEKPCDYYHWHSPYFIHKKNTKYFAIVRNPYDKIISEFYYVGGQKDEKYVSDSHLKSFYLWLDDKYKIIKSNKHWNNCHILPQHEYIFDSSGKKRVDHIIYMDKDFKENLDKLFKKYNLGIDINELKKDNRKDKTFSKNDINQNALNKINEMYSKDFEKLGFTKLNAGIENFTNKRDNDYYEDYEDYESNNKKIGLCFLIKDNFKNLNFYNKWLEGVSSDKYQIYIHWKNKPEELFEKFKTPNMIDTKWGDISLVKATLNMFDLAVKDNCNIMFLLSNDTLPLKTFDEIYKINNNELVYFNENQLPKSNTDMLNKNIPKITKVLNVKSIYKQIMFFCIKKEDYIKINFRDFLSKFENVIIPDEWFFVNILIKNNIKINNGKYIYVNSKKNQTQSLNFNNEMFNKNKEDIEKFYFIRKIDDFRDIEYFKNLYNF